MKKVAVIAGGISSERDVSLMSGQGVLDALKRKGYDAFMIDFDGNLKKLVDTLSDQKPDVIFNALHGRFGEDGNIQGVFNLMKIPYTHSGCLSSALAMNKKTSKIIFELAGIPVAKDKIVTLADIKSGNKLDYPYVIKPINEGSSVGVYIIRNDEEEEALITQWPFAGSLVMMEEYIAGRELSAAVFDDKCLGIIELVPVYGFYDYENKYKAGKTNHINPAPIPKEFAEKIKQYAIKAHNALGCRGATRTDFRYDDTVCPTKPRIIALELNNQPGMTPLSLLPEMAKSSGISYDDLICSLLNEAKYEE